MDPLSLVGMVGSIGGGIINNLFAGKRQDEAQAFAREQQQAAEVFNAQQAANQEMWFRQNRQTGYQDTMYDMKLAGLNPILAYQRGVTGQAMGASPSVSPVGAPMASASDIGFNSGFANMLAANKQKLELENMKETNNLIKAQTEKTKSEKLTEDNRPANVQQQTKNLEATYGYTLQQMQKGMAEALEATSLANWLAANPQLAQAMIVAGYAGGKVGDALAPFLDAVKSLAGGARSSAPSTLRPGGGPIGGHSSKNMSDQDMLLGPNSYKRSQPGFQAAPPKPDRGWFTDRWQGMYE